MNGNLEPGQVGAALPDLCIHPGNAHQDHDNSLHMLLICHNSSHHVLSLTIILLQVLYQDQPQITTSGKQLLSSPWLKMESDLSDRARGCTFSRLSLPGYVVRALKNRVNRTTPPPNFSPISTRPVWDTRNESSTSLGTPPPVYRSHASFSSTDDVSWSSEEQSTPSRRERRSISNPRSFLSAFSEAAETECGIKSKYANQGKSIR